MPSDESMKAIRTVLEARWKESAGTGYYSGTRTDIPWRWQEWWIAMEAFIPVCADLLDKMMAQARADERKRAAQIVETWSWVANPPNVKNMAAVIREGERLASPDRQAGRGK